MAKVRVIQRGIYADPRHKAAGWSNPGDEIDVADGWYVDSLITDGFVERIQTPETPKVDAPVLDDLNDENVESAPDLPDTGTVDLGLSPAGKEWDEHTILELRDYARDLGVMGYTTLRKADLVEAILDKQMAVHGAIDPADYDR